MTTPDERLRALTAELRDAVAEVREASREARETLRDLAATDVTGTAEYQRLEREAAESFRSGGAGDAARTLQERVDGGELTWQEIREGTTDPEATRLYLENQSAFLDEVARVKQAIDEEEADDERADAGRFDPEDDE